MTFDEAFLSHSGGIHNNDLTTVLDINDNETNEPQTIRHSSNYDYDKFNEFIINTNDICWCFECKYSIDKLKM